jgi:hypothetical protein
MSFRDDDFKPAAAQPNTLGAANATTQVSLSGHKGCGLSLAAGTLVGTLTPEISVDGNTWTAARFIDVTGTLTSTIVFASSNTAQSLSIVCLGGTAQVRVRVSAWTSGSAQAYLVATDAVLQIPGSGGGGGGGTVTQGPTGTNAAAWWVQIGDTTNGPVAVKAASTAVGASDPALAVSLSPNSPLPAGSSVIGAVTQSGTWTVQPGNTANTTPWLITIQQGGNVAVVKAASTAVVATDPALAVSLSPNSALPTGANVIGAVTQSGTWTVQPGNTANTTAWLVKGALTNNNAAPAATNFGVLPALANAADPSNSEGNQTLVSLDLAGYLRVRQIRSATGTVTSTAASTSSTSILASNTARKGATIVNSSTSIVYINMGATATSSAYTVPMNAAGAVPSYYEVPFGYTGAINAIWVAANGNAIVTEFT